MPDPMSEQQVEEGRWIAYRHKRTGRLTTNQVERGELACDYEEIEVVEAGWEDAAKNIALDGAGRAVWTGEAKAGLERILDLTTSEEIRAICSSLLDLDPADERYVETASSELEDLRD